jgi:hypothetical protein
MKTTVKRVNLGGGAFRPTMYWRVQRIYPDGQAWNSYWMSWAAAVEHAVTGKWVGE